MITVLTGAPGHGKTYTTIKLIDEFVHAGKPVVTNVPLREDFAYQMARRHTPFGAFRKEAVERKAVKIAELVHVCQGMDEIMRVRFEGDGEGRGKVVIDESHREINVRGSTRGKSEEASKRKKIVAYSSAHRHYGADLYLITQALGNLDLQVRNLLEFHAEVRNFRKMPLLGWITRLIPGGQLFVRVTRWNDKAKTKAGVAMYGLSKRLADLYNTHSLEALDWPDDPIMLPSPPETRPLALVAGATDEFLSTDVHDLAEEVRLRYTAVEQDQSTNGEVV
jgi:hypothetical protein